MDGKPRGPLMNALFVRHSLPARPRRNRLAAAGGTLLAGLILLAVLAPVLSRMQVLREPLLQNAKGLDEDGMPRPPGVGSLLGTDNLGRDVLARVIHGTRVSLPIAVGAMLTASLLGVVTGLLAGFFGGKLDLAGLLGGVIFVEDVFALPGIGTLAVQSVFNLDVPMIMGTVLFSAVVVVLTNLIVDLLHVWIDPRIKTAH